MRKYEVFQNFHIACSINSTFDINAAIINTLLKIVGLLISKFHFQRNFLTKAFNFSAQIFHIFLIFLYILHHFPQIFDEIFYFYAQIFHILLIFEILHHFPQIFAVSFHFYAKIFHILLIFF